MRLSICLWATSNFEVYSLSYRPTPHSYPRPWCWAFQKHHSAPGSPATCSNLPQPETRQLAAQARHLSAGGVGQAAVLPDLGHGRHRLAFVASAGDGHSDTTECCRSWGKKHPDAIAKILRLRTSWNGFDPCWYGKLRGLRAQLRPKEIAGGTQHLSLQRCHQRVPEV